MAPWLRVAVREADHTLLLVPVGARGLLGIRTVAVFRDVGTCETGFGAVDSASVVVGSGLLLEISGLFLQLGQNIVGMKDQWFVVLPTADLAPRRHFGMVQHAAFGVGGGGGNGGGRELLGAD